MPLRRLLRRVLRRPAAPVAPLAAAPPVARPPEPRADPLAVVLDYHQQTVHYPHRYARSLGFMDWDTQPEPLRWFEGAPRHALPLAPAGEEPRYEPAFLEGLLPARPLDRASVGQLLQDSLGLSAWKQAGAARWALRMNPSSGNLHPTEGYLVAGPIPGLPGEGAVYHYAPGEHALERRRELPAGAWAALGLPPGAALAGLTSIHLRESWKYGERAYRYCQHDVGHALAALAIAAAGLGWRARLLEAIPDADIARLLGIDVQSGPEAERPDALLLLTPGEPPAGALRDGALLAPLLAAAGPPQGSPNRLAEDAHPWPIIDEVAAAAAKAAPPGGGFWRPAPPPDPALVIGDSPLSLRRIIHQRRSAVEMDGRTGVTAGAFLQILAKCLPGAGQVPFAALPWEPSIDLLLFVHRVQGLPPGLYALARSPGRLPRLKAALDERFAWEIPGACPPGLPLYLLQPADVRAAAAGVSCGQAIAADGCFAAAMLADFAGLRASGPWLYRRLHWEAGALGQVLYLEAEASGVRATGIGCFFDAETHRLFGLKTADFQDIYHFTVGGAADDQRLQTLPPYGERLSEI